MFSGGREKGCIGNEWVKKCSYQICKSSESGHVPWSNGIQSAEM